MAQIDTVTATMGEALKEFARLENERRDLEDRLSEVKAAAAVIQERLLNDFADAGMQSANVDGLTVYVRMDRFVSKRSEVTTEQVCQVLRDCGLGYMVADGYNASSLKGKISEYQKEGVEVPQPLAAVLNIGEVARLATRKS